MRENADQHFVGTRGMLALAASLFLAPLAWILHQQSNYVLVYWACDTGNLMIFHATTIVLIAMALAGTWLAHRTWVDAGPQWSGEGGRVVDRSRFLALGGLLLSGLFALAIFAQWIPTLIVNPCVR